MTDKASGTTGLSEGDGTHSSANASMPKDEHSDCKKKKNAIATGLVDVAHAYDTMDE